MRFAEYEETADEWITIFEADAYPDFLEPAAVRYGPAVKTFRELVDESYDSVDLLKRIEEEPQPLRVQLLRVFRRYVSPDTPVEGLKVKKRTDRLIAAYSSRFRPLAEVSAKLAERPEPDEALLALLAEQGNRGGKGYDLTETFFTWAEAALPDTYQIDGPRRAGSDILLPDRLAGFPVSIPADFLISRGRTPVVTGFARYDSDRGGAQEDDRIGGNRDKIVEILRYARERDLSLKVLLVNDGPGLTLGSMWRDYAALEALDEERVRVCTLKMLDSRRIAHWIQN